MDGNRRWAKEKGLPTLLGHEHGYQTFRTIADHIFSLGIHTFTVYAFSTENWSRPKKEVAILFDLFCRAIKEHTDYLNEKEIQLRILGDISTLPQKVKNALEDGVSKTKDNTKGVLNIAINYGGRAEILHALRSIIDEGISSEDITEELFSRHLYTSGLSDPDLVIRTSGEQRLSGFLPWQAVYSELFFSPKCWPDFTPSDLDEVIDEFGRRQRRFGS